MLKGYEIDQIIEIKAEVRQAHPEINWHDRWTTPIFGGPGRNIPMPGKVMLLSKPVKGDLNSTTAVGIGSKEFYSMLPDEVILYEMEKLIPSTSLGEYKLTGSVDSAKSRFEFLFPTMEKKLAKVGDRIAMKLWAKNGSDAKTTFKVGVGALDLKCLNGMMGYSAHFTDTMKHKTGTLDLGAMYNNLQSSSDMFDKELERWDAMIDHHIDKGELEGIWTATEFGPKHQETILSLPLLNKENQTVNQYLEKGELNAWTLYSAMTQFLTHNVDSEMVRLKKAPLVERALSFTN